MLDDETDEEAAVVNVILREMLEDRENGGLRSLTGYQERHRAHSLAIAREFDNLREGDLSRPPAAAAMSRIGQASPSSVGPPISDLTLASFLDAHPGDDLAQAEAFARLLDEASAAPAAVASGPPDPGERFGPYRILGEIGRGGQGVVLLAEDTRLPRVVALKLLHVRDPEFAQAFARFRREAGTASRLDHPGICTVYETGVIDGVPFIAMRRVEGEVLSRRFERMRRSAAGRPPAREEVLGIVRLLEEAARALHVAHEAGIVHRDVKPGNIVVTAEGQPVLLDFGLARDDDHGATITLTGDALGTPAYVSPEQLGAGGIRRVDRRADVWGLGVALYEGVCGRRPFEGATREGLFREILSATPQDPRRLNPAVSRDLKVVLATAIEKDRDRRYQSASAFADDLRRIREHEPILARAPGPVTRLLHWTRRKPAVALAIVLLIAGTGVSTVFAFKASASLAEWGRLADARRFDELVAEADGLLWPATPEKIPAAEAWIGKARDLVARLPDHEAALEAFQARALDHDALAEAADRASYTVENARLKVISNTLEGLSAAPTEQELRERRSRATALGMKATRRRLIPMEERELRELEGEPGAVEALARRAGNQRTELRREQADLEARIAVRRTWAFAEPEDRFRHEQLREMVESLRRLREGPSPGTVTISGVEERMETMRRLQRRLEGEDREVWERCIADVARPDAPPDLRLGLRPVPGLVPLGTDEASGLWEFWHVPSGGRPAWMGEALGPGHVELDPESGDEGLVLVLLPGGTFGMGARIPEPTHPPGTPNAERFARLDEHPVRDMTLSAFLMSKYEVTQAQWQRLLGVNPSFIKAGARSMMGTLITGRHPVTGVDWYDGAEACRRWGLVVPTEAQWEYACRAGTTTSFHTGSEAGSLLGYANLGDESWAGSYQPLLKFEEGFDDGFLETAPVGSLRPNPFGLHDVHGNVAEWCRDMHWMYAEWDPAPGDGLRGPTEGGRGRVSRGGSFIGNALKARSAFRTWNDASEEGSDRGLRPALSLHP